MKKIIPLLFILCLTPALFASWSVGAFGGADYNIPERNTGWADDVCWDKKWGYTVGTEVGYSFNNWFTLKSGITVLAKNYSLTRTGISTSFIYTDYKDLYLELPIMSDFSFGGKALRGHALAGVYLGLWASEKREGHSPTTYFSHRFSEKHEFSSNDKRFNFGLTGGLGISYKFASCFDVNIEGLCYYDLTSYVKQQSSIIKEYRYNTTFAVQAGITYFFKEASR